MPALPSDFAIFILTHGRPDRVFTAKYLAEFKYTGRVFLAVDDEDKALPKYRERFGDKVLTFSKADIASRFDEGDNFNDRRSVFYARNACWDLAKQVGARYFMQMDDDYTGFYLRYNREMVYASYRAECLDDVIALMIEYFKTIPALSIAMSQGGDHIGGEGANRQKRKAMNTFLCDVERPFSFVGRINEDVNTYTALGRKGELFLTIPVIQMNQKATQSNAGGMTDLYLDAGTYVKSFYSVMYNPSAVKIGHLQDNRSPHPRIHHAIDWKSTTAQIIREEYRKARSEPAASELPSQ